MEKCELDFGLDFAATILPVTFTGKAQLTYHARGLSVALIHCSLPAFIVLSLDGCIDLLVETERVAEAALFARTHRPSRMSE